MMFDPQSPPTGTLRDWLNHRAATQGNDVAYLFTDGSAPLSWADLRVEAARVAHLLTSQGAAKGESVAVMMPNGRDGVIAFFGVVYGGFRATMVNLVAGDEAIGYVLDHCDAKFAFVGPDQMDQFNAVKPNTLIATDINAHGNGDANLHDITAEDHALLMYTSGTTGRPKGVVHTNASLLAGGWTTAVAHELSPDDRGLCVLPICHINGLCVTVIGTLIGGGSLLMAPRFSASKFWGWCADHAVTWFSVVPTIISHLVHGATDAGDTSEIRFGRSASAPLAPEVQTAFEDRFGIPIVETMGLTETAAQILSNPLPPGVRKIGSPGLAYGNEVAILAADGTICAADCEGEIAIRGPNVLDHYLKNPEATAKTFNDDGWLLTGDLGKIDADGYVFVTGRLKELIIKGGENIAPREVDEALYAHADVVEAGAFGRPCPKYGEKVEAAVRLTEGSHATSDQLITLCIEKLGPFKAPDTIHILAELPKGPSGKIQRLKLMEML